MRIHKLKVILVAASILALGAGVFAGMAVSRLPVATSSVLTVAPDTRASIAEELQLTDVQRDQMRSIWEGVRSDVHETLDRAQIIQKEQDAAVAALLSDSQKARYAALTQEAAEKFAALGAQRDHAFHDGVDKTRKILNESQRQTYDRIIRDRIGDRSDSGNGGGNGVGLMVPTSEPAVR